MKDTITIILFGETNSGKTNLGRRYAYNEYREDTPITLTIDWCNCNYNFSGKKIKIKLWDTPGQNRFRAITKSYIRSYIRGSDIIILVYSVDNRASFEKIITFWLPEIKEECEENGDGK